jgi:hypothetical protein
MTAPALVGSLHSFQLNAHFVCDPIYFSVLLFDSVPTRFCLGTWQTVLSSPLLVMWKSNPLTLGPRLIGLFEWWSLEY